MYLERYKEYHGLTLEEVARITGPNFKGYAVCLIPDNEPDNVLGDLVGEALTLAEIITARPALANCVVKYSNNFYGQIVLRVAEPKEA